MLLFLLIFSITTRVEAEDDDDDDEGGLFGEDVVKVLGTFSLIFMGIGSTYVVLKRSYVYSKRYLVDEKYEPLKKNITNFYKKRKGPMLSIHNISMVIATILGVIHGIFLGDDFKAIGISGWIAAILMIIMSASGLIIWLKFRPIWDYKTSRSHLRFIHRQWLFSGIVIVALILHMIILED